MKGIKKTILSVLLFNTFILLLPAYVEAGEINLSMAASMKDAVTELADIFAKNHQGVTFQKNSGASGAIAKQIGSGAPADIFISANVEWMDYLKEKGLIETKNTCILAYNSLVFIGRHDLNIKSLQGLTMAGKVAIGSPKSVPAGEYAMNALIKTGVAESLEKKLVMAKDVRECLMYAERGEVDGAFVYRSDARQISDRLKVLFDVPQELYPRVTCPAGLTSSGAGNADAGAFFNFLQTEEAKAILIKYGFMIE